MAYDEGLAERIREVLPENGVDEKKMFGGLSFMLQGNMACGIIKDDLLVRVGREDYERYLKEPHVHTMTKPMRRPMRGFVMVDAVGLEEDEALAAWVQRGVDYALALPSK